MRWRRSPLGPGAVRGSLKIRADDTAVLRTIVAAHNAGSIRVLEKCGFRRDRVQEATAPAPNDGTEELIFVLGA
jgi:hypothetical protein